MTELFVVVAMTDTDTSELEDGTVPDKIPLETDSQPGALPAIEYDTETGAVAESVYETELFVVADPNALSVCHAAMIDVAVITKVVVAVRVPAARVALALITWLPEATASRYPVRYVPLMVNAPVRIGLTREYVTASPNEVYALRNTEMASPSFTVARVVELVGHVNVNVETKRERTVLAITVAVDVTCVATNTMLLYSAGDPAGKDTLPVSMPFAIESMIPGFGLMATENVIAAASDANTILDNDRVNDSLFTALVTVSGLTVHNSTGAGTGGACAASSAGVVGAGSGMASLYTLT